MDRLLDGAPIHLVNTDPPYNVKVEPRSNNAIAAGLSSFQGTTHHQGFDVERHPEKAQSTHNEMRAKDRPLMNDFVSDDEFDRLLQAWFGNRARVLLPGLQEAARANWPDCSLDVGDGRRILPGEIRNAIRVIHPYGGAKAFGSGQTAEDIRRLRETFATHERGAVVP